MSGFVLKKDKKNIKKENYVNDSMTKKQKENAISEYKYDIKTDVVPKKNDRLIIIMLNENKGCSILFRKFNNKSSTFRFNKGRYIIETEGVYITRNSSRIAIYIEGVSVPIRSSYVEKILKTVKYKDLNGNEHESTVQLIKGLRFDAKIFDIFSNREFAEIFTQTPKKTFEYLLIILVVVNLVLSGILGGLIYYFR